jgi:hypothetical protein
VNVTGTFFSLKVKIKFVFGKILFLRTGTGTTWIWIRVCMDPHLFSKLDRDPQKVYAIADPKHCLGRKN